MTGRRHPPLPTACLATLALALSACAGVSADGASDRAATAGGAAGSDLTSPGQVTSVIVRRTGGLAGIDDTTTVGDDDASAGPVLAMAAMLPAPAASGAAVAPCCDRISYRVRVRYGTDKTVTYVTWDGDAGPVLRLATAVLDATGGTQRRAAS